MNEHNFFLRVRYGLTEQLFDFEWNATITSTGFDDEDRVVESFRAFYKHIHPNILIKENEQK